jgi:hypothetical protein
MSTPTAPSDSTPAPAVPDTAPADWGRLVWQQLRLRRERFGVSLEEAAVIAALTADELELQERGRELLGEEQERYALHQIGFALQANSLALQLLARRAPIEQIIDALGGWEAGSDTAAHADAAWLADLEAHLVQESGIVAPSPATVEVAGPSPVTVDAEPRRRRRARWWRR